MSKVQAKGQVEKKLKAEETKKKQVVEESSDSDDSSSEEVVKKPVAGKKDQKAQEKTQAKQVQAKKQVVAESSDDSDDSEEEAPKKPAAKVAAKPQVPAKKAVAKKESSDDSDDSEEEAPKKPAAKVAAKTQAPAKKAVAKKESSDDSDDSEEEEAPKKPAAKVAAKKAEKMEVEEDDSEESEKIEEEKPAKQIKQDQPIQKAQQQDNKPKQQAAGGNKFSNEVIVKGLSFDADENDIGNFMEEKFGEVARVNLLKGPEGRSKGIAFISFETPEGQEKAVAGSNCDFMGRYLIIEKTQAKEQRPAHLPVDEESKTIFVGNLSFRTDKESLRKFFESCGQIQDTRIATSEDGKSRGFGHVEFTERSGVEKALTKAGSELDGRPIKVDVAASRGKREGFNRGGAGGNRGPSRGPNNNAFAAEKKGTIAQFQGKITSL